MSLQLQYISKTLSEDISSMNRGRKPASRRTSASSKPSQLPGRTPSAASSTAASACGFCGRARRVWTRDSRITPKCTPNATHAVLTGSATLGSKPQARHAPSTCSPARVQPPSAVSPCRTAVPSATKVAASANSAWPTRASRRVSWTSASAHAATR